MENVTPDDHAQTHPVMHTPRSARDAGRALDEVAQLVGGIERLLIAQAWNASSRDAALWWGALQARWSAIGGAHADASAQLDHWADTVAELETTGEPATEREQRWRRHQRATLPQTAQQARTALERLERPESHRHVVQIHEFADPAPVIEASSSPATRTVTVLAESNVFAVRAAGPYLDHWEEDFERQARDFVSQSPGVVSIGVSRATSVPLTVTVRTDPPPDDALDPRWDHVTEASIAAPAGELVVVASWTPRLRVRVPAGMYRIRAYTEGLASLSDDLVDGDDAYHVTIWPDVARPDAVVLKRNPGTLPAG